MKRRFRRSRRGSRLLTPVGRQRRGCSRRCHPFGGLLVFAAKEQKAYSKEQGKNRAVFFLSLCAKEDKNGTEIGRNRQKEKDGQRLCAHRFGPFYNKLRILPVKFHAVHLLPLHAAQMRKGKVIMNNKALGPALTGAAVGMAVGAAAYMMKGSHHKKPNMKKMKKSAGKVIRSIGGVLDDVTSMVK